MLSARVGREVFGEAKKIPWFLEYDNNLKLVLN